MPRRVAGVFGQVLEAMRAGRLSRMRRPAPSPTAGTSGPYPGDFVGIPPMTYAARPDGRADPGEVVWTWVPYEEDWREGKDRPVLVIGFDDPWLLALPLTSQDHDADAAQEHRAGREWVDIGSGAWDPRRRPSEVRVNRILRIDPTAIRREGAAIDEATFTRVAVAVRAGHGD